ncbi:MAG TPA: fumarylacetoacetate hydrolase family protein, partial [Bryobacteraceae bacterium]|nr:fumarylacetoacetate hydrolase family protein [Bryobacteraceae bacterium]
MNLDDSHDPSLESWVESANLPDCDFPVQNLPLARFSRGGSAVKTGVRIGDSLFEIEDESRADLVRALRKQNPNPPRHRLVPLAECNLFIPIEIGDYSDFYASIFHATNVGSMFRPDNPLLPNYKYVPIGYHGRASSIVVSGTDIKRPSGQLQTGDEPPVFGPSRQMDYECEVGCCIGRGNELG